MSQRDLYLVCYDVAEPRRRMAALKLVRQYSTGGQKSAHEIFLTPAERNTLVADMRALLEVSVDRFMLLHLESRSTLFSLGKAAKPADPVYFYLG